MNRKSILMSTLALNLVCANMAMAAMGYVPKSWISNSFDDPYFSQDITKANAVEVKDPEEDENSNKMIGLTKSYQTILETNELLLEEIKSAPSKKWQVTSVLTKLGIEQSGLIGLLGVKGESFASLIWKPRRFLQANKSILATDAPHEGTERENEMDTIEINDTMTPEELEMEINPVAEAAIATGKVKNKEILKKNLMEKALEVQKMVGSLDEKPAHLGWWLYKFQLEIKITAEGKIIPVDVGVTTRMRFQWTKIERNKKSEGGNKEFRIPSPMHKFVTNMATDLAAYDTMDFKDTNYDFSYVKFGIGIGVKGSIFVAKTQVNTVGSIFFRRDPPTNKDNNNLLAASSILENDGDVLVEEVLSPTNADYAKKHDLEVKGDAGALPAVDKSLFPSRYTSGIFRIQRRYFRKGLARSARIAKFFMRQAARRNPRGWYVDAIELEFELYLSGKLGLATLQGKAETELYFVRRK